VRHKKSVPERFVLPSAVLISHPEQRTEEGRCTSEIAGGRGWEMKR